MALKFRKVARKVLSGAEKGSTKYYAVAKKNSVSKLNKICKLISARSTVSSADVKAVFDNLSWAVSMELESGNAVQLGELGNFHLTVSSEGAETAKELDANKIKKAKINFSPGAELREMRRNLTYEPAEVEKVTEDCERVHAD